MIYIGETLLNVVDVPLCFFWLKKLSSRTTGGT